MWLSGPLSISQNKSAVRSKTNNRYDQPMVRVALLVHIIYMGHTCRGRTGKVELQCDKLQCDGLDHY